MPGNLIGDNLLGRIRAVTDRVEATPIAGGPMRIPTRFEEIAVGGSGRAAVRIATYTGSWPRGTTKSVTPITGATASVSAYNHFIDLQHGTCTSTQWKCAIAKDGTAWNLIQWELRTATAIFVQSVATTQVLTNVTLSFNTTDCSISQTNTTSLVTAVGTTATNVYVFLPSC